MSLELSSSEGLSWLVETHDQGVLRVLESRGPAVAHALEPGATAYVVHAPYAELVRARPGADAARIDRSTLSEASSDLEACGAQRFVSNEAGEHLEVPLAQVAELRALVEGELEAVTDWPSALDALSVKVPVPPCAVRSGVVGPFLGEVGPLVRQGDRLGSKLVVGKDAALGGILDIFHLDEHTLLVALPATLVLVERGRSLDPARLLDLAAPSEILGGAIETEVLYVSGVALPAGDVGQGLRFYFLLQEWVAGTDRGETRGLRLIELQVEAGGFGSPRLVERLETSRADGARLSVDEEGRFVIGFQGELWSGRLDASAPLRSRRGEALDSLALVPASSSSPWMPRLVGGGFELSWVEGDPDELEGLKRVQWSGAPVRPGDSITVLRTGVGPDGPRLFSASSIPSLYERRADGWRQLESWYPEDLPTCLDARETCGRRRVRRGLGGSGLLVGEDGHLAQLLRECDAVFWVDPDQPGCAEHILVDTRPYWNGTEGSIPSLRKLSRWGDRLVLGGDASVLVEVTLD